METNSIPYPDFAQSIKAKINQSKLDLTKLVMSYASDLQQMLKLGLNIAEYPVSYILNFGYKGQFNLIINPDRTVSLYSNDELEQGRWFWVKIELDGL